LVKRIQACAALGADVSVAPPDEAMATVKRARERAKKNGWGTFVYLDPPFWSKSDKLYRHSYSAIGHENLADRLHWHKDPFLLSYDPAPEIAELYKAHSARQVTEIELLYGTTRSAGKELVISNLTRLPSTTQLWRSRGADRPENLAA
jgi:site-specific DNA-adenine methylase